MSTETTLAVMQNKNQQIVSANNFEAGFSSTGSFDLLQRAAKLIASSTLIPREYQNNIPNCAIALEMSMRIGCGYLQVMQNLDVVQGRPAWRSKFLIATVNSCGRFSALEYEFFGEPNTDSWGCRAYATAKYNNKKLIGVDVTIAMAKAEGWYGKTGSKWKTIPQKMLMYRAAAWWSDLHAPELSMGLHTADEMHDVIDLDKAENGTFSVNLDALREQLPISEKPANNIQIIYSETGEIKEPIVSETKAELAHPSVADTTTFDFNTKQIGVSGIAGNVTQPDYDKWRLDFMQRCNNAPSLELLGELYKNNVKILAQMKTRAIEIHQECEDCYQDNCSRLEAQE